MHVYTESYIYRVIYWSQHPHTFKSRSVITEDLESSPEQGYADKIVSLAHAICARILHYVTFDVPCKCFKKLVGNDRGRMPAQRYCELF